MDMLDLNIALDIASRVGSDSFADLAGMLATSRYYHFTSCHPDVLKSVSLLPFHQNAARINLTSVYRPFFSRCLEAATLPLYTLRAFA